MRSVYAFAIGCLVAWAATEEYDARQRAQVTVGPVTIGSMDPMLTSPRPFIRKIAIVSEGANGQYYADGEIFGSVQRFLIDTGAYPVALRYEAAERMGLKWEDGRHECYASANGEVCARTFTAPTVTIAGITKHDVPIAMFPKGKLATNLAGMAFLSKLSRYEISYGTLRIEE